MKLILRRPLPYTGPRFAKGRILSHRCSKTSFFFWEQLERLKSVQEGEVEEVCCLQRLLPMVLVQCLVTQLSVLQVRMAQLAAVLLQAVLMQLAVVRLLEAVVLLLQAVVLLLQALVRSLVQLGDREDCLYPDLVLYPLLPSTSRSMDTPCTS